MRARAGGSTVLFIDATAGSGGHSEALLEAANEVRVLAFDRDAIAVARCRERLARFGDRAVVTHLEFSQIEDWLRDNAAPAATGLVADLVARGKNAHHFPHAEAILEHLLAHARQGDLVLIMSNGGFEGIHENLLNAL